MSDLIKELIPTLGGESEESAFTVESEEQSNENSQNNDDDSSSNSLSDVVESNENFAEGSIPDDFQNAAFNALIALPSS